MSLPSAFVPEGLSPRQETGNSSTISNVTLCDTHLGGLLALDGRQAHLLGCEERERVCHHVRRVRERERPWCIWV